MNGKGLRFWLWAGAATAAGLLLRLWFVIHLPRIAGDSYLYGDIAKNLIQHGVYGFTESGATAGSIEIRPTLIRLPGYPLFIAACFRLFGVEHYRAVMNVQIAADLGTAWLASALAGRLFGQRAALAVLWLAALCPFTANYAATLLTETLVLTSIALAFYSLQRWQETGQGYSRWLWLLALAMDCSLLLRPEQGLLAAAILPAMLWRRLRAPISWPRVFTPVVLVAFCVILPLFPWTMRNWTTFHVVQPLAPPYANDPGELPPTGFGRWYRTWAVEFSSTEEVYWNYSGDSIQLSDLPARAFDAGSPQETAELRDATAALLADYNASSAHTSEVVPEIDARFGSLGTRRIRQHPGLYYLALPVARLLDMALRPRTEMMDVPLEWWRWKQHHAPTELAAVYAALNLIYFGLGAAGLYVWRQRNFSSERGRSPELAFALLASLGLRAALLLTIDNSEPRYTLECFPVIFVLAGALFAEPPSATSPGTAAEQSG